MAFDALVDFYLYIKDLMMTKQEIKQEYKNNEGDQHIKSARKQLHRELLSEQTKANILTSKMVLANPTHIALGIYFNPTVIGLPFISVIEKNSRAVAVIAFAEKNNIPVIRNISLARRIFKTAKIYTFIDSSSIDEIMRLLTGSSRWNKHGKMIFLRMTSQKRWWLMLTAIKKMQKQTRKGMEMRHSIFLLLCCFMPAAMAAQWCYEDAQGIMYVEQQRTSNKGRRCAIAKNDAVQRWQATKANSAIRISRSSPRRQFTTQMANGCYDKVIGHYAGSMVSIRISLRRLWLLSRI